MSREIEADGCYSLVSDLNETKPHTCITCRHFRYDRFSRVSVCTKGKTVGVPDWRTKYEVCDEWKEK